MEAATRQPRKSACGSLLDRDSTRMGLLSAISKTEDNAESGQPPKQDIQNVRIVCCEVN